MPHKRDRWAGPKVTKAREHWSRRLPMPCFLCRGVVDGQEPWVVEHMVPRYLGGSDDLSNQSVSHRRCSDKQGGQIAAANLKARRAHTLPETNPWPF